MGSGVIANGGWTLDKASSFGSEVVYLVRRVQIAWDYLDRSMTARFTGQFLVLNVEEMIRKGERRRLLLSNRTITSYERLR